MDPKSVFLRDQLPQASEATVFQGTQVFFGARGSGFYIVTLFHVPLQHQARCVPG